MSSSARSQPSPHRSPGPNPREPQLRWMQRCEILQNNYGFICACVACAAEFQQPTPAGGGDEEGSEGEGEGDDDESTGSDCDISPEAWGEVEEALDNA